MYETTFHQPSSLAEAAQIVTGAADGRFIAGGQTLIPTMKQRLAAPSDVVDVTRIAELQGIEAGGDTVTIGAASTHHQVATSDAVRQAIPALAELAGMIGDPAVRYRGTIGGSLANNDPAADYPAAVLALDGVVHTDKREIAAADFFMGMFSTALDDGEIITRVVFSVPEKAAYTKFRNPASRYPMAGVFVARKKDGAVRAAVTGASGNGVFRSSEIEQALSNGWSAEAVGALTIDSKDMLSDIHGSAAYRANLVKVMARRAVAAAGG